MLSTGLAHLRRQWIGALALSLLLSGGTAVALDGHNSVFSDDIAPGEVRSKDLASWTRPHALLLSQFGNDSYSSRHLIGGIGRTQLLGRCITDGETGYGFPALDLYVKARPGAGIGYAFQRNPGNPTQGEATIAHGSGEANVLSLEVEFGSGSALADGQIVVRDGDRAMTFVLHAVSDNPANTCRASGTVIRGAP